MLLIVTLQLLSKALEHFDFFLFTNVMEVFIYNSCSGTASNAIYGTYPEGSYHHYIILFCQHQKKRGITP